MEQIAPDLELNWPGFELKIVPGTELVREARLCLMSSTPVLDEHRPKTYCLFFKHDRA